MANTPSLNASIRPVRKPERARLRVMVVHPANVAAVSEHRLIRHG